MVDPSVLGGATILVAGAVLHGFVQHSAFVRPKAHGVNTIHVPASKSVAFLGQASPKPGIWGDQREGRLGEVHLQVVVG